MNHVAIEKAKLLGFDHSSVITDAEKYMNNLETFKCYNFFSQNFPGCIILKEEDFINLNVKYGLVSGPLSYYKGDKETWNLSTNKFHKVSLLTLSPNYWNGAEVGNKHYFFILDGCKNPSPVRGFFNEYLRSELSQDRKTFEMLANKMKAPYSDNQLSGLGFSSTIRNSVICKVTGSFTRTIKVNF